jgi:hypothetical protein
VVLSNVEPAVIRRAQFQPYAPPVVVHVPALPGPDPMVLPQFQRQLHPIEVTVVDPYGTEPDPFDFYENEQEWNLAETDPSTRPAVLYTDARIPDPDMLAIAKSLQGRRKVIVSWNCYADDLLPIPEVEKQISDGFDLADMMVPELEWWPWIGLFRGPRLNDDGDWEFAWTGQEALEVASYAWGHCVTSPQVKRAFVWASRRPEHDPFDGVSVTPEFQQAVAFMRQEPRVEPVPEPVPEAEPWWTKAWRKLRRYLGI